MVENNEESEVQLRINPIENRLFILSPVVESGDDRESTVKDFYQENNEMVEIGKLGTGMKVIHRKTNAHYIIIHFEKTKMKGNVQQKINNTLELMYNAASNYLLRLLNHYEDENKLFLILESFDGDTLENKILNNEIDSDAALRIFYQICKGVEHLHSFKLANISVTPETVLITEEGNAMLTDYGLRLSSKNNNRKPVRPTMYTKVGATQFCINAYTSPEELNAVRNKKKAVLSTKTDSWNVGILLYEMLTNFKSPFKGRSIDEIAESILKCEIDLSEVKDAFCRELIASLVKLNPEDRQDISEILKLSKFADFEDLDENGVDINDCVINGDDEGEYQPNNLGQANYDYDHSVMQSLKFENESLRKQIEELEVKMSSNLSGGIIDELTQRKTKKKNNEDDDKMSEIENEEEEDDDDDEMEFDEATLRSKYRELKNKFEKLNEEYKEGIEVTNKYSEEISKLQNENNEIEEELKVSTFDNIESLNESSSDLYELNEKLNNAIETFCESQSMFKEIIEKMIKTYGEQHELLMKENKTYINDKNKILFDVLEKIKKSWTEGKESQSNPLKEQIDIQTLKIKELSKFKAENENVDIKDKDLYEELCSLKEIEKKNKEELDKSRATLTELQDLYTKVKKDKDALDLKFSKAKLFITMRCEGSLLVEKLFQDLETERQESQKSK